MTKKKKNEENLFHTGALIITDVQRDFMPGGPLGVSGAHVILEIINQLQEKFRHVIAIRDWHPSGHISFASSHGKRVGEVVEVGGAEQILWPDHCIQNTRGAEFADGLRTEKVEAIFDKGSDPKVDSYSGFFDCSRGRSTGLADFLTDRKIKALYFVGVATDYCILHSVLDAIELGFKPTVIIDACRPINRRLGDEQKAIDAMKAQGAIIETSDTILKKEFL